ncbi:universal stress protein [bacterium]|nr:universal stress protein [bacterium]
MSCKILIAVDNQECTDAAIQSALARQWEPDTTFMLCKVVEDFSSILDIYESEHNQVLKAEQEAYTYEMRLWLSEMTADFAKVHPQVESCLEFGRAAEKLCELAYSWGADYMILGSHDLELASRCSLGSIASAVLRNAPCSVESVRSSELRKLFREKGSATEQEIVRIATPPPKTIIVATDLSPAAEFALNWVVGMNWHPTTVFRIVTVMLPNHKDVRTHWFGGGSVYIKEKLHLKQIEAQLKRQAQQLAEKHGYDRVEADVVMADSAAEAIFELATNCKAELVVTGAQGANRSPEARAGSTAISILERLHCSMIAIQSDSAKQVHFTWR